MIRSTTNERIIVTASPETRSTGRPTTVAIAGLLLAALFVLAIIPVRGTDELGFSTVVAGILIGTAALVWRFGRAAHAWAALLGLLLALMFGSYTFAGIADGTEPLILIGDLAITVGGVLTLYGAVAYHRSQRRLEGRA